MDTDVPRAPPGARGTVELRLRNVAQLFNSLDPAPFHERDLDRAAEEFIVGWVRELPHDVALSLVLHLREWPDEPDPERWIGAAIRNYFNERARVVRADRAEELRRGRFNFLMGTAFLLACLLFAELFGGQEQRGIIGNFLYEGLTIVGWVALWRPLEVFLYDYWHLRGTERLYRRIAAAPFELKRTTA
ncbi:hypothetical protein AAG565_04250 [Fontimonas sp. SYSU GA230001]|uniref:hypothetical protein n=1 Tax=Fontimonas sp. SYSU GA230001 TaxID=3142450 RepID=UPI0032B3E039